mgnify:CR=1 FL=1
MVSNKLKGTILQKKTLRKNQEEWQSADFDSSSESSDSISPRVLPLKSLSVEKRKKDLKLFDELFQVYEEYKKD